NAPVRHNLEQVGKAVGKEVNEITVVILDRPRNADYIRQVREAGARISLIGDGDIQAGIATCVQGNGIDIALGIGGSPEAVTTACAMAALQGEIQCKLWPRDDSEREYAADNNLDLNQVLTTRDLVDSDNTFFAATGVTGGPLLKGVNFGADYTSTHSVIMRSRSGTIRFVDARHRVEWVEGDIKP
ncbi:MAG: fructose-bisphosphatase class II, partial [Acidimicrobiia bacterium]